VRGTFGHERQTSASSSGHVKMGFRCGNLAGFAGYIKTILSSKVLFVEFEAVAL
jgi:hypothetical protein